MLGKKGLLALSSLGLLAVGTVAIVASTRSTELARKGNIAAVRHERLADRSQGAAIAGNAFYVNLSDVMGFWFSDGYTTHAYFFNDLKENAWVTGFTEVPGDSNVYEVSVPSGYSNEHPWTNVIVCRATASDWEHVVNEGQTGNMVVNSSGQNGVTVQNSTWWDDKEQKTKRSASSFTYTAETRILKWINASGSGSWTNSGICDDQGQTDKEALENSWKDSGDDYGDIAGLDVKSYFSNVQALEGGTTVQDIAARYDHILDAHPTWDLENFASR